MEVTLTLALFALLLCCGITWGGRVLPREGWQMLASVPVAKQSDGSWRAINLTWYGALNAVAYTLATGTALLLLGSTGISLGSLGWLVLGMLGLCIPASKLVARIVEGKANTFSVGGASFVGIVAAPWIAALVRLTEPAIQIMPVLAALSIAYALGEGVGRLACLSFGCCYGRPVDSLPRPWQRLFARWGIVFEGATKKAAYAHNLNGRPLVPVQLMTAYLYCAVAVLGMLAFFHGHFALALLAPLITTQVWRVASEFLRADYRGNGRISAYQIMAAVGVIYGAVLPLVLPAAHVLPDAAIGLHTLWSVPAILLLQAVFLIVFIYTGRSSVTGARICFHVHEQEI